MALFKNRRISLERLDKYQSDIYWTDVNFRSRVFPERRPLSDLRVYSVPEPHQRPPVDEVSRIDGSEFKPTAVGASFGPSWSTHWFKLNVVIPAEWRGRRVVLVWDSNNEAMLYEDSKCLQAFTGGTGSDRRALYILQDDGDEDCCMERQFLLEMACNGMFGNGMGGMIQPPGDCSFALSTAEIAIMDTDAWGLLWDFIVLSDIAQNLPAESPRAAQAMALANDMINVFDRDDRASWTTARDIAKSFFQVRNADEQHEITAVGHCHIDTAWLWPYAETRRKVARSWATQLELQRRTPFTFAVSQAVQLKWLKEDHPQLFEDVKRAVAEGRFAPVGGTFVEMDANMPCGESFVRQFLYGQRFFFQEFGKYCEEFWLPDTFGYSAQLPQLMKLAGIKYFMSQKISWNLVTKFPNNSFVWKGVDGSAVLAHFPPADTYTAAATVSDLLKSCDNCKDKAWSNRSMLLYGHGDGGGGPAIEHLERLTRSQDVSPLPRVAMRSSPQAFFQQLEEDFKRARRPPPTWQGELYLELHQGTLTSQALVKQRNRECERALHNVEWLLSLARCSLPSSDFQQLRSTISSEALQAQWEAVLLNQFHDVLPGSSIGMVYEDAHRLYSEVLIQTMAWEMECLTHLVAAGQAGAIMLDPGVDGEISKPLGRLCAALRLTNTTSFLLSPTLVEIPRAWVEVLAPELLQRNEPGAAIQWTAGQEHLLLPIVETVQPGSIQHAPPAVPATASLVESAEGSLVVLENQYLRATITRFGTIKSLIDKRCCSGTGGREVIEEGSEGNTLMLYENVPFYWDAWDVMPYHLEKGAALHTFAECSPIRVVEQGPLRTVCSVKMSYARAAVTVNISLSACSDTLDFTLDIDWQENRKLLKVEFPLQIVSDSATYEIQFGALRRPNHGNTEADAAKYEVCAQRFADLCEGGYGVALLNKSKYGYSCRGSTLCMSLLRAPKAPDAECDLGFHRIQYALFPHVGDSLVRSEVVQRAIRFNHSPLLHFNTDTAVPTSAVRFRLEQPQNQTCLAVLDTVKLAEDNDSRLVLRLYEAAGGRGDVQVFLPFTAQHVTLADILERPLPDDGSLQVTSPTDQLTLCFKPFEVKTLLVDL